MEEKVVLVNGEGEETGLMGKLEAHEKGLLHKAFSIILFNSKNQMLLQQRAEEKYHWPLIWSNACCSHPRAGEKTIDAANRRLLEELGIQTELNFAFKFQYKAQDALSGLTEHELDEVFIGNYDGEIPFNATEIADVKWMNIAEIESELKSRPENYSVWFIIIIEELQKRKLI